MEPDFLKLVDPKPYRPLSKLADKAYAENWPLHRFVEQSMAMGMGVPRINLVPRGVSDD